MADATGHMFQPAAGEEDKGAAPALLACCSKRGFRFRRTSSEAFACAAPGRAVLAPALCNVGEAKRKWLRRKHSSQVETCHTAQPCNVLRYGHCIPMRPRLLSAQTASTASWLASLSAMYVLMNTSTCTHGIKPVMLRQMQQLFACTAWLH